MSAVPNLPQDSILPIETSSDAIPPSQIANGALPLPPPPPSSSWEIPRSFSLLDRPADYARKLRVIVVGAGYSGIYCGIRIPERLRNVELVIYEKNKGVGGAWWENRYLGCACDVPSHSYQFSFEPNTHWSSLYAPAKEIQGYLEGVMKKYSVDRFVRLDHQVTKCRWDEKMGKWCVSVKNLQTGEMAEDTADVVISARGNLNTPKWPDIEGLESFGGEKMHSATWNERYDYSNKRIGVIGSGSSSIQIVPSLQRLPGTNVTTFVRSRTWISPSFGSQLWHQHSFDGFNIPLATREKFTSDPEYYHKFRLMVEEDGSAAHPVTVKGTEMQQGAAEVFKQHMKERLKDAPHIFNALLPSFSPGCRRLTPGPGYLEALTQPNVSFITSPITHISSSAVHTEDGQAHEIDTLVCATGFHTSTAPPFPIIGSNNLSLAQKWENRPSTYLSHSTSSFSNFFTMLGPNAAIGSGSLTMMIESIGDYIIRAIRKIQKDNIQSMSVKKEREEDFLEYVDRYFEGTVFGEECASWYKKEIGVVVEGEERRKNVVTGLWPGSTLHCLEVMRSPRWEDYEYRYIGEESDGEEEEEEDEQGLIAARSDSVVEVVQTEGGNMKRKQGVGGGDSKGKRKRVNRLAWLGNGWTRNGLDGKDLAFYLYPEFQDNPVAPRPEEKERLKIRPFSY
ncbi:FAD/NAD(P)-binding domain-containing protein [Amniculicola lignicola CBS 123094]|uniref:L-ornithine N(5)-monooxygenase [NAD(P)H] n=1 Tax=Amniculicola lignicola CBS 123094 TaxID=1392246 RepID=A0A6A5WC87_9PLEO|nr:FAD/NAD(P)-binding domain-containing protein [Amniculicola lignicola CBS 123094]